MRGVFRLMLTLCLFAGLATGTLVHAAEAFDNGGVSAGRLHSAGDHDPVPADADKNYPHHHSICHGHDLTASAKACGSGIFKRAPVPRPVAEAMLPGGSPAFPLRPPIA